MTDTPTQTDQRRCTICGKYFKTQQAGGRPLAFCSQKCKRAAHRNPNRRCIICGDEYALAERPSALRNNPFYCSTDCQQAVGLCNVCRKPARFRYCSVQCLQTDYPPPYTCRTCQRSFMPSAWTLSRPEAAHKVPKYCSSDCFEHRDQPGEIKMKESDVANWASSMLPFRDPMTYKWIGPSDLLNKAVVPFPTNGNWPWFNTKPAERYPYEWLNNMCRHTIEFWRHIFKDTNILNDLNEIEYMAFLVCHVLRCQRLAGLFRKTWLVPALGLWPYLEDAIDRKRFNQATLKIMCNAWTTFAKRISVSDQLFPNEQRLGRFVRRAHDVHLTSMRFDESAMKDKDRNFLNYWLKAGGPDLMSLGQVKVIRTVNGWNDIRPAQLHSAIDDAGALKIMAALDSCMKEYARLWAIETESARALTNKLGITVKYRKTKVPSFHENDEPILKHKLDYERQPEARYYDDWCHDHTWHNVQLVMDGECNKETLAVRLERSQRAQEERKLRSAAAHVHGPTPDGEGKPAHAPGKRKKG